MIKQTRTDRQPGKLYWHSLDAMRQFLQFWVDKDRFVYLIILLTFALGVIIYLTLSGISDISTQSDFILSVFGIALFITLFLIFFIGRQMVRLWAERKQKLAGSQLHLRLALLFGGITAIPAILLAIFAISILDYSLRGWFAERISTAVSESVQIADSYFEEHSSSVRGQLLTMANDVNREAPRLINNRAQLNDYINNQTAIRNLSEAVIIDGTGQILAKSQFAFSLTFASLTDDLVERARGGEVVIITNEGNNKLQAIVKLNSFVDAYLLVGRFIDAKVLDALNRTKVAASDYQLLSLRQFDLQISLAVMFAVVALLLLLSSLWLGLKLANSIAVPLVSIMSVADKVRTGNLRLRVPEQEAVDEISQLGASFNRMLDELSGSREQLVQANRQLDTRREFTEAVLGGVSSGVIGLDADGVVTLPNQAACRLLGRSLSDIFGKKLSEIVPEFGSLLLSSVSSKSTRRNETQIELNVEGTIRSLHARATGEKVEGRLVGYVVTFDDITELQVAQRKAAWSDVARRIAHEIKNPLTPIALATDRLKKKFTPDNERDAERFGEYLTIISRQVGDIGRMVDEFSQFARMPAPSFKQVCLRRIVEEHATMFGTDKSVILRTDFPENGGDIFVNADPGMLRQALTNVIQNASESLIENGEADAEIILGMHCSEAEARIIVSDNGPGFPAGDISRFLEPYMTTRSKGTGLGLAIVQKIMTDHGGNIHLGSSVAGGAEISLVLPLSEHKQESKA
ncbi:PAS domain-containing sensor histidine kinase [Alphaproteobacteria bacterium]|nr:PAS domain-containing sensor histidine kinase [Alphaproteobacteria bacterium]